MPNNQLYDKLVQHVVSQRPDLAPFAELFQNVNSTNEDESETLRELQIRFRKLSAYAKTLHEDLEDTLIDLDDLARALGACEECWGQDRRCNKCRGMGKPGYSLPNEKLFRLLILPALSRMPWIEIKENK